MIFTGNSKIDADIVDDGSPTSVVFVGDGELGGDNSYTGTTFIIGRPGDSVLVTNGAAIPVENQLEISGRVSLALLDPSRPVYEFSSLGIRDGGRLSALCCDGDVAVSADAILLEEGTISAPIVGETHIVKQTDGMAVMRLGSPELTGQIDVVNGMLVADADDGADGYLAFGQALVRVGPQGRLTLGPIGSGQAQGVLGPSIRLDGGAIYGAASNLSDGVNYQGALAVAEDSSVYLLDGTGDHPVGAEVTIDGKIDVAAGKSLSVNGFPMSQSALNVTEGIQLGDGSVLGGNGTIRTHLRFADGAVLSPGRLGEVDTVGGFGTAMLSSENESDDVSTTWAGGGRYRWQVNHAEGDVGAPFGTGWDVFQIGLQLKIEATPADPFIIEVVGLDPDGEIGLVEGLTLNTHRRWLIAEAFEFNGFSASVDGFDASKFAVDVSSLQSSYADAREEHFWLDMDESGVHLNALIATGSPADFNGDGLVDDVDLNDPTTGWETRFGAGLDG
ncbi:MAG: hypothetical protein AAF961_13485, partial [Planctomycetota bacterium]